MYVRWELQHGSLLRPVLQQEVQFKGDGEGSQLTEGELAFPRQFSRAAFPGTAHFLLPYAHYVSTHVCECTTQRHYYFMLPRDSPYQIGFVRETGAGPDTTTALDRRRSYGAITPKKSKSCPLFKLASIQSNVLYVRFFFSPFVFLKRKT